MRGTSLLFAALCLSRPAQADVIPDMPEPQCEPGYVVEVSHGGVNCVRPHCRTDSDCPSGLGLVCPVGYCYRLVEDRPCLDSLGARREDRRGNRNAFEPPPPCPPIQQRVEGSECRTREQCPDGTFCSPRRCTPGDASATMTSTGTAGSESMGTAGSESMETAGSESMGTTGSESMGTTGSESMGSESMSSTTTGDDEPVGCSVVETSSGLWVVLLGLWAWRRR